MSRFKEIILETLLETDIISNLQDLPGEEWRDIPGFIGEYQISNLGRVKSLQREILRPGDRKPLFVSEKILKPAKNGIVNLRTGPGYSVSRLVLQIFKPEEYNPNLWVIHKDGDLTNNRLDNLFTGTPTDSGLNSVKNGRCNIVNNTYSKNRNVKIKCIETGQIFDSLTDAAKWLNVNHSTILKYLRQVPEVYIAKDGTKKEYLRTNVKGYHFEIIDDYSTRKIQCIETGQIFNTRKEVADFINKSVTTVDNHLKNPDRWPSINGYHFEYISKSNTFSELQ